MLEIPEAIVISRQLNQTIKGKCIRKVVAAASPHKFTWYYEDPAEYNALLRGRTIENAYPCSGRVEISTDSAATLNFGDGANLRYYESADEAPEKHQLLIIFDDNSALVSTVTMYACVSAFPAGAMDDNFYYKVAKDAISPLSDEFNYEYFSSLLTPKTLKLSAKAFLATEQRIPGLGNGVLHDILLNAKIHPKRKMNTLSDKQLRELFDCVKSTLAAMVNGGGRDTERDLFGNYGRYKTKLSKNNKQLSCPNCGHAVIKANYLGGSIYFCTQCQIQ